MAEILEVKTVVDTTQSAGTIDKLIEKMDEFVDVSKESIENQKKFGKAGEKAGKDTSKGTSLASKGFKKLGDIIKINPLGLLVGTVGLLVAAFKNNQKVMDVFTNVLGTISAVGTQVANVLSDVVDNVSNAEGGFDSLTKVAKGLMTLALTPIKLSFYALSLGLQEAQLAWEKSFLGDKDPETIKELNAAILETKTNIAEVAFDAVGAGKSVVTNFAGAIEEVGKVSEGVIKGVKDISIEATYETVKANTELKKSAELAEAGIRGLIEKYDLQAEKQRQIRDDDRLTFKERIEANEKLAVILQKQQEEQLKLAQVSIDAAKGQLKLDKNNQEAKVALQVAENEYAATLAQVAGFEAEQLTNRNSLLKEQKQIVDELALVGKSEFERKKAEALQERDQRLIDAELAITDEQAKKDALAAIEQEYQNQLTAIDAEAKTKKDATDKASNDKKEADAKALEDAKIAFARQGFALASSLAEEGSVEAKAIAVAQATFEAYQAVLSAYNAGLKSPLTVANPSYPFIQAGIAAAFGAVQIKKILSTPKKGGGASPSVSGGGGGARPSTEVPRIPNFAAMNEGVGGRDGFGSVRAVVIQQDIKDSASLDNRVDDLVKIGK